MSVMGRGSRGIAVGAFAAWTLGVALGGVGHSRQDVPPGQALPGQEECAGPGRALAFQSIAKGVVGELKERGSAVVRTQEEWETVWKRLGLPLNPAPAVPTIDFSREIVLGVYAGQGRGVLQTEIVGVEIREQCLVATVHERMPPEGFPAAQFESFRPFHFIRLASQAPRVVFHYRSGK